MQIIKNYRHIFLALTLILFTTNIAKSTEECFEGTSRAIFKFNMALDDIVFEPLAKGYNKLPSPIKQVQVIFTSNIGTLLSIPNNVLQGNFTQLAIRSEVLPLIQPLESSVF
jgi:phospholipid-binding lipoprotein MlaA